MKLKALLFLSFSHLVLIAQNDKELLWEEHFNGDSLSSLRWNYETGDGCPDLCGWGNNERQIYNKDYVTVKDGFLMITADKVGDTYYSGKINTRGKAEFRYGTIEIRAKVPEGKGLWPALWMLGSNIAEAGWPGAGEIDIMEYVGRQPDTVHTSLHTPESHGNTVNTKTTVVPGLARDFHTYGVSWNSERITFFIDSREVYTFSPEPKNEDTYPFKHPFYFLINMAVGGNFGGPEVDDSIFPQQFIVDYIKVYR